MFESCRDRQFSTACGALIRLRETVDLAAIRKDRAIFIDQIVGPQRLRTVSAIGQSFPPGRAFERRTPTTITNLNDLLSERSEVRTRGFALDREQHTLGDRATGIAVKDHLGNLHAISVPVPTARVRRR